MGKQFGTDREHGSGTSSKRGSHNQAPDLEAVFQCLTNRINTSAEIETARDSRSEHGPGDPRQLVSRGGT
jgi:hypothetical protein